jgi:tetratricopeptide (TPR) repeat protein
VDANMIGRWERGSRKPSPRYAKLLTLLYDLPPADLGLATSGMEDATSEALELARLADASDAGQGAVESTLRAVERLRREYARTPPRLLAAEIRTRLRTVRQLLQGRLTLSQHRDLLASAGWLSLLAGTVHFDLRNREAAQAYRDVALQFAREAGHTELEAWAWETPAWFAVFDHRYRDAVDLSRAAQAAAPPGSSVEVVAHLQEGRAWARLGATSEAMAAMQKASVALESLPPPVHADDHYSFDPPKFGHYAANVYAWLNMPRLAEEHARNVIRECGDSTQPTWWPVRVAFAQVNLGLALVQRGEYEQAGHEGAKAFDTFTRGSTLSMAGELDRLLLPHGDVPEVRDFHERFLAVRQK